MGAIPQMRRRTHHQFQIASLHRRKLDYAQSLRLKQPWFRVAFFDAIHHTFAQCARPEEIKRS
jgi:hypothetical protein